MDYKEYLRMSGRFKAYIAAFKEPNSALDVKKVRTLVATVAAIQETYLLGRLMRLEVLECVACHKEFPKEFADETYLDLSARAYLSDVYSQALKKPQNVRAGEIAAIKKEVKNTLGKLICKECGGLREKKLIASIDCPVRCNC